MNQKIVTISICVAFWSTIVWLVQRTFDRSDEPWGLLSLATVVFLLVLGKKFNLSFASNISSQNPTHSDVPGLSALGNLAGLICLLLHFLLAGRAPFMVHGVLMILALWFLLVSKLNVSSKAGILGLLFLVLPVMPSVDFYAGYPVRFVVAAGASSLLWCLGMLVHQEGTVLSINQRLFAIDVPCSGIHMLWVEAYAIMLLATLFRLRLKQTVALGAAGCILILIGNVFRAATLIVFDLLSTQLSASNVSSLEPIVHPLVGLFSFCLVTGAISLLARKLASVETTTSSSVESSAPLESSRETGIEILEDSKRRNHFTTFLDKLPSLAGLMQPRRLQWLVVSVCVTCAVFPFVARPTTGAGVTEPPTIWPGTIDGAKLTVVDSLREEQAFAADFPGHMKRFTDGTNSYFVRCVNKDTRQLHPSSDCFRGLGYVVESRPIVVGPDGHRWSSFTASKDQNKYLVMERIYNERGESWTDVSEWYWAACLGKSKPPWFAVTIAKPL
jgi:exosortase/archaeosortase family protein